MKCLRELIVDAYQGKFPAHSLPDLEISGIECDSRKVEKNSVFVVIRGVKQDGAQFIREAAERGASFLVLDQALQTAPPLPYLLVPDAREAAARLASAFHGHPSASLKMIGVTGTNGKTTSCYLLEFLLSSFRKKTGMIGTVSYRYAGREIPATETTPGPLKIQQILAEMKSADCEYVAMEVSSHALDQKRVEGIDFSAALFTNLTQDHLDYHKTFEAYFECKAKLFLGLKEGRPSVINADDPWGKKLAQRLSDKKVVTYGLEPGAALRAENVQYRPDGTHFELAAGSARIRVEMPLVGRHNVYNALGALGVMQSLGFSLQESASFLKQFRGVPGRLESIEGGQDFRVYVDFAHTPDGLENVLKSLQPYRQKKLYVVFGCGGDRDKTKRPLMGRIASQWADHVIVTSDNPRSENPKTIAEEIRAGFDPDFKNYTLMLDRKKAIRQALLLARGGDMVLLAGKGHERTQIIGQEIFPFSDKEEVERVLNGR